MDDHALVRRGIRELLADAFPGAQFGEAGTGEDAISLVERYPFDIAILDISMPRRGGIDALKEIQHRAPALPVLVLSQHAEEEYAIRVLRAGGKGYLSKSSAPEELVQAVRKLLEGGKYVSPRVAERLVDSLHGDLAKPRHESLSDRELQVLRRLASGRSVKEIAAELALSEKTISTYRTRMLEKMDMKSNADLIRYALQVGLVE